MVVSSLAMGLCAKWKSGQIQVLVSESSNLSSPTALFRLIGKMPLTPGENVSSSLTTGFKGKDAGHSAGCKPVRAGFDSLSCHSKNKYYSKEKVMAVKEILVDDIDGETEGAETLTFFVDGQEFAIDLADENYLQFQEKLDQHRAWLKEMAEYGRPVVSRMGQVAKSKPKHTPEELATIREWLRSQGHKVSDFGRIKDSLMEKWETRSRMPKAGGETEVHGHGDPKAVTNAEGK